MKDPLYILFFLTARPEWTAEPQPVNAGVEEKAVFECAAEGLPPPTVTWYINGKSLDSKIVYRKNQKKFGLPKNCFNYP